VLDFAPEVLEEAKTALERIYGFLERAERELGATRFQQPEPGMNLPDEFVSEMNEDLNIPAALAVIHEAVRSGNTHLDEQRLREASQHRTQLYKMLEILGLAPSQWLAASSAEHQALDLLIQSLIVERNAARESRDYARADAIRDSLIQAGIELSDATNQTHWSLS
jgi:cysteinyl-tRNA synthetase